MIRYALRCSTDHRFEAWFRSAGDFDQQRDAGLLACPACGDNAVSKALMAPAVATTALAAIEEGPPPAAAAVPAALASPETAEIVARLRALKAELLSGSEDVGKRFAEEARRIHHGESPVRAVHGQATTDDARALFEEGVGILPLPILPEERN